MNAFGAAVFLVLAAPTLKDAESAYFGARLEQAESILADVEKREMASAEITSARARIHLLRSALHVKQGDVAKAEESARRALFLDPELDATAFPPPVQELVGRVLATMPARVVVRVVDVPPGSEARVDGRALPASGVLAVVPGAHQLWVRPAGGRPWIRTFQATTPDFEVSVTRLAPIAAATPVAVPTRDPAVSPPVTRKPITRRPVFWGAVGVAVAVGIAGGLAASGGSGKAAAKHTGETEIQW